MPTFSMLIMVRYRVLHNKVEHYVLHADRAFGQFSKRLTSITAVSYGHVEHLTIVIEANQVIIYENIRLLDLYKAYMFHFLCAML